ncbi:YihY/virulence factor BrkB family protein [Gallicola sp. Sow4_E12]|uniref:YihY/virulence factor BrkB family protein n=1 Tax=Gallicola sp. Sow4_E12 TaxID=3438785 RepID=UPI003F91F501
MAIKKEKLKTYAQFLLENIQQHRMTDLSAQSAYFLILALFPFIVVVFNLLTMFAADHIDKILSFLSVLPEETVNAIEPIIYSIINSNSAGIISVSIIVAFWSSSKGVNSIIRAMNIAFGVENDKSFIRVQLKSLLFTFLLLLLIFAVLASLVFGDVILKSIESLFSFTLDSPARLLFNAIRFAIPIAGMILGFSFLFKRGPDFEKEERIATKSAVIGGVMATIGWMIISLAYSFYVSNISNMSVTYGPLVGIMALFIWLNLSSLALLFTSEFVALYDRCIVKKLPIQKDRIPGAIQYY